MTKPLHHPLPEAPEGAVLVSTAKSVNADPLPTPPKPSEKTRRNRAELFRRQRVSAAILTKQRVAHCCWSVMDLASIVSIVKRGPYARFGNLQTCGSVWHCPVCSARVSEVRRVELNKALVRARALGLGVVLITLTARHSASDPLPELLEALKAAKKHWHNSRTYKAHKGVVRGMITATELTHGANGWHPHFHLLVFLGQPLVPVDVTTIPTMMTDLQGQWLESLEACGLSGAGAAFDWQGADQAGQYVAKWGAAEEMTLTAKKGGDGAKTKGRHPFDFLRTAAVSPRDRALFFTYAVAFKGRRQLQWTPGLRDLLAVPDVPDKAAASTPLTNDDEWLASITKDDWKAVRVKGRAAILEAIEDAPPLSPLQPVLDAIDQAPDVEA